MEKQVLANLEPKSVLRFFEELTRIPHGSGNTAAASDWAEAFARERGLKHRRDELGNVVIWKDASPGYEGHPTVMLQGHLDMVCVKDSGVEHDFTKDPLDLYVDGDWIKARGTTLGGDDGIAVAMAMAVLDDDSIPHPPLEAVFTVDEEVGMPGAVALDCSDLKSRYLLNIDSEAEGVLTAGCAGGARCDIAVDVSASWKLKKGVACEIHLEGLSGGHSGTEIHKGHANANKLLAECLRELGYPRLCEYRGGEQDNAIPKSAAAVVLVSLKDEEALRARAESWAEKAKAGYPLDPGFTLRWVRRGEVEKTSALSKAASRKVVWMLLDAPNGVLAMNPDLPGQVQTSLNLGVVRCGPEPLKMTFCIRSSVAAEKEQMSASLKALASANGGVFDQHGDYPPWEYRKDSALRETMVRVFREQYGKDPAVETIHAGLECGVLSAKLPGLDAVALGPDLVEIHTVRERMSISSLQRTWAYLVAVLREL